MNLPIANFITRKKKKRENRGGHMIKCYSLSLVGPDGKVFDTRSWRTGRAQRGAYAMVRAKYFPVRPDYSVNKYLYYMAHPVLGKSLCSDWFFLGQDFAVRTVSMETVQSVYF